MPIHSRLKITGKVAIPDMTTFLKKSEVDIKNLTITKVEWAGRCVTLGFSLSDGQSVKAGPTPGFNESHIFNPAKKITRVEV